jgi:RluA family pseudouridine synthase
MEILFENEHLLAVSKPSGQVVIPGRGDLPGEPLKAEVSRHTGGNIFVVHRLDRGASGLVLFAKDAPTHRALCLQFENRTVRKSYLVLVQGQIEKDGRIDQPLKAFGSGRTGVHPQGKPSQSDYRVRERFPNATLVEVTPLTGRRHQIRAHFYSLGYPVMGDTLYGKERPVGGARRLMLHAWKIDFVDLSGRRISLCADPPADFGV